MLVCVVLAPVSCISISPGDVGTDVGVNVGGSDSGSGSEEFGLAIFVQVDRIEVGVLLVALGVVGTP